MIDDKYLLLAHVDKRFIKQTETKTYTYYHLIVENKNLVFGLMVV